MTKTRIALAVAVCTLACAAAWAQTPQDAINDAVANSGAFPAGTSVVSVTIDGANVVVDLNAEAAAGLTDSQSDAMVQAIMNAIGDFEGLTDLEVTAAGLPLWQYLPPPPPEASAPVTPPPAAPMMMMAMAAPSGTTELAGKVVNLHPSHGTYLVDYTSGGTPYDPPWWAISQRTLCGPNPTAAQRPPDWDPLWQSVYQPSNYYYNTMKYQWPSYYEDFGPPYHDSGTPEFIRFLAKYCETSGATVRVSRELDKNAGEFDEEAFGYVPAPWPTPMYRMAAMYNLQAQGYPSWIWTAFLRDYDADIRSRPYFSNYHMALDNAAQNDPPLAENDPALWGNYISIHLHTNAAGSGTARGTETYWYTSIYTYLQTKSQQLAAAMNSNAVQSVKNQYDGFWAEAMYPTGTTRQEWPTASGTYRGYDHDGPSTPSSTSGWQNRGVKTGNYGEIREAKMPAVLMELLFHDDWKFYPDHVFEQDQIFRSTVAWGMYRGICEYWGITPKARLSASVVSVDVPAAVSPGETFTANVTMANNGQAWCWGHKFDAATKTYNAYTVWELAPQGSNELGATAAIQIDPADVIMPGDMKTFAVQMTAPSVCGTYSADFRMVKNDQRGGVFGEVATVNVTVGSAPVVTIGSPGPVNYAYGWVDVAFDVVDEYNCGTTVSADIDGVPVYNGQTVWGLGLGSHTITVSAQNAVGSDTESVTFQVVNTVGSSSVGGWIELAKKKGTCGMNCSYVEGDPAPTGHITYQDHDLKMTVHSVEMIALGVRGNKASFHGTCTIEGEYGHWFRVDVTDNGEPGRNDTFDIYLDTGYHAGGTLGGGNVQVD